MNMDNLTPEEIERMAYVSGMTTLSHFTARAIDAEDMNLQYKHALDKLERELEGARADLQVARDERDMVARSLQEVQKEADEHFEKLEQLRRSCKDPCSRVSEVEL